MGNRTEKKTLAQDIKEARTLLRCEQLIEACEVVIDSRGIGEYTRNVAVGQILAGIAGARADEFPLLDRITSPPLWSDLARLAAETQHAEHRAAALVERLTSSPDYEELARVLLNAGPLPSGPAVVLGRVERAELARFVGLVYWAGLLDGEGVL